VEHRDEWSSDIGPVVAPGIYHIANKGQASWYEVATRIGYALGASGRVMSSTRRAYCDSIGMPETASPSFTCLDLGKYNDSFGPEMPEWTTAIDEWCKQAKSYFA
jgi:dTDP-4-dehydrorhamnose reductase